MLVTGGAGYIGSHAVKGPAAAGAPAWSSTTTCRPATGDGDRVTRAAVVDGDIHDTARVRAAIREHGVDAVMHFAAWLSVGDSVRDPVGYYHNNVVGALSVLDAMVGRKRVDTSSSRRPRAVFGNPIETPITEIASDSSRSTPTAQTKLAVEHALPHYETAYGIRSMALRYFNAAGADPDGELGEDHAPEMHLIPRAIDAALGRATFQVFGDDYDTPDGTCLRDYVHVTDLARRTLLALEALRGGGGPSATTISATGGRRRSGACSTAIERVTGRKVPYTKVPRRAGDPAMLFASSERIRQELGWKPQLRGHRRHRETAWRWRDAHPHGYGKKATG